jgi:hypothetical protein
MRSLKRIVELGGLHDARVRSFTIGFPDHVLSLELDDFYANFEGDKGYPGVVPGAVVLSGISGLSVDLEPFISRDEIPWICELEATPEGQDVSFVIRFSPTGCVTGRAKTLEITEDSPESFRQPDQLT